MEKILTKGEKKPQEKERHIDGQKAQENMLNFAIYYKNAHQNYNEVSPHSSENSHHQKVNPTIQAGEDVEKREHTVAGNVNLGIVTMNFP